MNNYQTSYTWRIILSVVLIILAVVVTATVTGFDLQATLPQLLFGVGMAISKRYLVIFKINHFDRPFEDTRYTGDIEAFCFDFTIDNKDIEWIKNVRLYELSELKERLTLKEIIDDYKGITIRDIRYYVPKCNGVI